MNSEGIPHRNMGSPTIDKEEDLREEDVREDDLEEEETQVEDEVEDAGAGQALSDFMLELDNYNTSIPDSVVSHYLNMSGFESQDPRIIRLIALAGQKFLSDIANNALQHCKMRTSSQLPPASKNQKGPKEKKYVMTMEDLTPALQEYGITAKKPNCFV